MRIFLLMLGLIPAVALGLDLYFKDRAERRDLHLAGTAARVLKAALGAGRGAVLDESQRIAEGDDGLWIVEGYVTLDRDGEQARTAYQVTVAQLCGSIDDDACWQPLEVVLDSQTLALAPVPPKEEMVAEPSAAPSGASGPQRKETAFVTAIAIKETPESSIEGEPSVPVVAAPSAGPPTEDQVARAIAGDEPDIGSREGVSQVPTVPAASPTAVAPNVPQPAMGTPAAQPVEMSLEESLTWLIQERLSAVEGSTQLTPSGKLDEATVVAIEAYRAGHGLPPGGKPSFDLLDHLDATLASQGERAKERQIAATGPEDGGNQAKAPDKIAVLAENETLTLPIQEDAVPPSWERESQSEPPPDGLESRIEPAAPPGPKAAPPVPGAQAAASPDQRAVAVEAPEVSETPSEPPSAQGPQDSALMPIPLTPQTLTSMTVAAAPATQQPSQSEPETAANESVVFLIQDRLNQLGYGEPSPLRLSGKTDRRTREAIVRYQRNNQLSEDGRPSESLLRHLESRLISRRGNSLKQVTQ